MIYVVVILDFCIITSFFFCHQSEQYSISQSFVLSLCLLGHVVFCLKSSWVMVSFVFRLSLIDCPLSCGFFIFLIWSLLLIFSWQYSGQVFCFFLVLCNFFLTVFCLFFLTVLSCCFHFFSFRLLLGHLSKASASVVLFFVTSSGPFLLSL